MSLVHLFLFLTLVNFVISQPCIEARYGFSSASLNLVILKELIEDDYDGSFFEPPKSVGGLQNLGQLIGEGIGEPNEWTSIAWQDVIVSTWDCSGSSSSSGDLCTAATGGGVIAVVSEEVFGDFNWRWYDYDLNELTGDTVEYVASSRPWFRNTGWVGYEAVSTVGEAMGFAQTETWSTTWENGTVTLASDPYPGDESCMTAFDEAPCDGAQYVSDSRNQVLHIGSHPEALIQFTTETEAKAIGKWIWDNVPGDIYWAAIAWDDEIVAVRDCSLVENSASTLCNGQTYLIDIVSNDLFSDNNWRTFDADGAAVTRTNTAFTASSRPWFTANGWINYTFVDDEGNDAGQGVSFAKPAARGGAVIVANYRPAERSCNVQFIESLCAGSARSNGAIDLVNAILGEDLLTSFTSESAVLNFGVGLLDLLDNVGWVGFALGNSIVTIEECINQPRLDDFKNDTCEISDGEWVISIASIEIYGDLVVRAFDENKNAIDRDYKVYSPSSEVWYGSHGWTGGDVGVRYAIAIPGGNVAAEYVSSPLCQLDLDEAPCDQVALSGDSVANAESASFEAESHIETLEDALELAASMYELSFNALWVGVAFWDEMVVIQDCELPENENLDICTQVLDEDTNEPVAVSVVSQMIFGDQNWHSFTLTGVALTRDAEEYIPSEQLWWTTNGWSDFSDVEEANSVYFTFPGIESNNIAVSRFWLGESEGCVEFGTDSVDTFVYFSEPFADPSSQMLLPCLLFILALIF